MRDLPGGLGCHEEEGFECRGMSLRIGIGIDVLGRDQIAPAQQLLP